MAAAMNTFSVLKPMMKEKYASSFDKQKKKAKKLSGFNSQVNMPKAGIPATKGK